MTPPLFTISGLGPITPEWVDKVFKALGNPSWDWRTIPGISKETGLPEDKTAEVLQALHSYVEKGRTKDNHDVYRLRREPPSEKERFWTYIAKSSGSSST